MRHRDIDIGGSYAALVGRSTRGSISAQPNLLATSPIVVKVAVEGFAKAVGLRQHARWALCQVLDWRGSADWDGSSPYWQRHPGGQQDLWLVRPTVIACPWEQYERICEQHALEREQGERLAAYLAEATGGTARFDAKRGKVAVTLSLPDASRLAQQVARPTPP